MLDLFIKIGKHGEYILCNSKCEGIEISGDDKFRFSSRNNPRYFSGIFLHSEISIESNDRLFRDRAGNLYIKAYSIISYKGHMEGYVVLNKTDFYFIEREENEEKLYPVKKVNIKLATYK